LTAGESFQGSWKEISKPYGVDPIDRVSTMTSRYGRTDHKNSVTFLLESFGQLRNKDPGPIIGVGRIRRSEENNSREIHLASFKTMGLSKTDPTGRT
ncbi:MAG: hypothetical protein QG577_932, partial [Thermodesulfobacteriota bacterium]|nr:hypothetical protein [Thermodesulfobacteriota bacterium]